MTTTNSPSPAAGAAAAGAIAVRRVEERVAVVVAVAALAAGALLVVGLLAEAVRWRPGSMLLRAGCAGLLAVPLARNAAVVLWDRRRGVRALAVATSALLAALYVAVLIQEEP